MKNQKIKDIDGEDVFELKISNLEEYCDECLMEGNKVEANLIFKDGKKLCVWCGEIGGRVKTENKKVA